VPYRWIRFVHIAAAIGFVGIHGASIVVLYAIRKERDRARIVGMLDFSSSTATAMYIALAAVVGSGVWLGFTRTSLFGERWYWLALVLLGATSALMFFIAKPLTMRVRNACEIRPSGVPRVSDEELEQILHSGRTHLVTAIGVVGLTAILYLMVLQPALTFGVAAGAEVTTSATSAPTVPGTDDAEVLALGKSVFDETAGGRGCADCHGLDGHGTSDAPNIIGASKSEISDALNGGVPEMDEIRLTPEELEAVYRYLQTLS
jgi:mono/diheme cytochrome c family protein